MISYEVATGLTLLIIVYLSKTLNLLKIIISQITTISFFIPVFSIMLIFFISALAETNRAPFDLPEAEAELVAGYNVEYSSISFALFFLGEYCSMIFMATLTVLMFFKAWSLIVSINFLYELLNYIIKIIFFTFLFILIRAAYPRYRYNQLMTIG
jgi:NADH-quinone oxidoreductase subunit H